MLETIIAWCLMLGLTILVVVGIVVLLSVFVLGILQLGKPRQYVADTDEREAWFRSEDDEDETDELGAMPIDLLEEGDD